MSTTIQTTISTAKKTLESEYAELADPRDIIKSKTFKSLYGEIPKLSDNADKKALGEAINGLRTELQARAEADHAAQVSAARRPIDVTAPFDTLQETKSRPSTFRASQGSLHPITQELDRIMQIFTSMGFDVWESRQLDNEHNMFGVLNFPDDHPARDDYDTFRTEEGLIPPAHTSTMQNRVLASKQPPIRAVIPGRVFRNEDVDATHGHTFYQVEGVYVDKGITLADMLGTIQAYLEAYFEQSIEYKTQPFYFPFVEPGLEFLIKTPKALLRPGQEESWMEIMGCGMIHPNVLSAAGIDSTEYSGFAWGFGLDRMVMLKNGIEDLRHFHSGKLAFLKQFGGGAA